MSGIIPINQQQVPYQFFPYALDEAVQRDGFQGYGVGFLNLPDNMFEEIADRLHPRDIAQLSAACARTYKITRTLYFTEKTFDLRKELYTFQISQINTFISKGYFIQTFFNFLREDVQEAIKYQMWFRSGANKNAPLDWAGNLIRMSKFGDFKTTMLICESAMAVQRIREHQLRSLLCIRIDTLDDFKKFLQPNGLANTGISPLVFFHELSRDDQAIVKNEMWVLSRSSHHTGEWEDEIRANTPLLQQAVKNVLEQRNVRQDPQ